MRLKKVFAGALAAAMLVCAVAVPAFAAEDVEHTDATELQYVTSLIIITHLYKNVKKQIFLIYIIY